ncbi:ABC transporter substrate-binding protein [Leeia aquatica]|uniref:Sugar ABC transporter substrate-binding protein n=1 Tax=Leeia aquatica TaxID=2725557 RepID=A0A847S5Y4_9NEIS|nr:sugar ABC transporter substrate-binding protein [Leeia aquatica]NLR75183.1 sugar ABC transporter substrate-binding protein [Leeia aquatica]
MPFVRQPSRIAKAVLYTLLIAAPTLHAAPSGEITVWAWDIAADALRKVTPAFNKQYPGVKVVVKELSTDQVYEQALAACAAKGQGLADVVMLENSAAEKYWKQFPQCFATLERFGVQQLNKDFPAFKWAELQAGGHTYALPWDSGPVAVFYRRDLYQQAGIDASKIETWDDFKAAGLKLSKATNGQVKMAMSNHLTGDSWFSMLANQNRCSYFTQSGNDIRITINQPTCVKAMSKLKDLVSSGIIGTGDWDGRLQALKANKAASAVDGAWYEGSIRDTMPEQSGKWGVYLMPAFNKGGLRAANNGGSALAISGTSKSQDAAWAFVKFALATKDSQGIFLKNGLVPSYLPALHSPDVEAAQPYWGGQKIWPTILATQQHIVSVRSTPFMSAASQVVVKVQNDFLQGKYPDAQQALDEAAKQIAQSTGLKIGS